MARPAEALHTQLLAGAARLSWLLLVAGAVAGCKQPPVVDLRIVMLGDVELGATARVLVRQSDGRVVLDSGTIPGEDVYRGGLFDPSGLDGRQPYVIDVLAEARAGECLQGTGRLVGRSRPFRHSTDGYVVRVPIGCGDELNETGPMANARVLHYAAATVDGDVIVGGGSQEVFYDPSTPAEPLMVDRVHTTIERYDASTARFEELEDTSVASRLMATGVSLPDGSVVAVGGIVGDSADFACHGTYERIWPLHSSAGPSMLGSPRCVPSVLSLEQVVVVAGLSPDMHPVVDVHDAAMDDGREAQPAVPEGAPSNSAFARTARGALMLAMPIAEAPPTLRPIRVSGASVTVDDPLSSTSLPTQPLVGLAVASVPCTDPSSEQLGAVYVTGGVEPMPPGEPAVPLDATWCVPFTAAGYGEVQRFDGALGRGRSNHRTILVPGRAGPRLLVIPGASGLEGEIVAVSGCSCRPPGVRDDGVTERAPLTFPAPDHVGGGPTFEGATTTSLPDGTVLVTGVSIRNFFDVTPPIVRQVGSRSAYLFTPDLIPETVD